MKLRNDLITEDTNEAVTDAIEYFNNNDSAGYADYVENKVCTEHDFYKTHMINADSVEKMNGLRSEYNAVIRSYIRGLKERV